MAKVPQDKRRFPRLNLKLPLRCQVRGEREFSNVVTENISSGGISFTGDKFIAPGTPVMLEINILSKMLSPIGKIAWSQPLAHSDKSRLGIEFLEFDYKEKTYLEDFIGMQSYGS